MNTCSYLCSSRGFIWSATTELRDLGEFLPYAVNHKSNMAGACGRGELPPQACVLIGNVAEQIGPDPSGGVALDINNRDVGSHIAQPTTEAPHQGRLHGRDHAAYSCWSEATPIPRKRPRSMKLVRQQELSPSTPRRRSAVASTRRSGESSR